MSKRNIYLNMVPPREAVAAAMTALDRDSLLQAETIAAHQACGRVTAEPVFARCSSPTYHSAAMDGIAVKAESTFTAREDRPLSLRRGADFEDVNTGNPLPEDRNAVIMIENVVRQDDDTVSVEAPAAPWQHVRRIGEDIVATELLIPQNTPLSAYDIGALLSAGIYELKVWGQVRATFIPTGDEVLDFTDRPTPKPGQVIESNSQVFKCMAEGWGIDVTTLPTVPDRKEALAQAVRNALDNDQHMVVIGAGSSAGSKDFTKAVFEELGTVLVHGIAVMPGKPSLLAVTDERSGHPGRLLVGAPGYPVSAVVCFDELLAPLASWMERKPPAKRTVVDAVLTKKTPSRPGMAEVLRLAMGRVGQRIVATPLGRGAGLLTTMTKAQAVSTIPAVREGIEQNETIRAELLVPEEQLDSVLVHVGSHDNTIDMLANELMGLENPLRLVSSHVGSMGGLNALKAGSALFAGCHLFDPETGDFNFPFIRKYLRGLDVTVINLAIRHQGLMVAKGNPLNIKGVEDLARKDVRFINRQRGAGTRILLDHHLKAAGINPREVQGYDQEEFTHMAVAVNVLTGAASCGLGIHAAAKALDLDFVPLAHERYDLIIPSEYMDDPRIQTLLELITSYGIKEKIDALGGYETDLTGQIMEPGLGLG
ncbi:molybdopterin biosynthesis protein [Salidesulfovibrio onnuriiensis]|uniref:molybdopterin biosynthesis protein n=1 Tax=Salidesulfovibrio onnuriiensis TaxID=2583823 RepID=UPI0011C75B5D|nr:molybdopterin biosynthesis protein [Salidesulfovibrio onnuriiensis]